MGSYRPEKCAASDYKNILEESRKQSGKPDQKYKCVKVKVTVDRHGLRTPTHATLFFDLQNNIALISEDQIKHLSDKEFSSFSCERVPDLFKFIRDHKGTSLELPFTVESKRPLYLPMNKSVAAGVILAFYNANRDPVEKIQAVYGADAGEASMKSLGCLLHTIYVASNI